MTVKADLKFRDVNVPEYKVILIPGGNPYLIMNNSEIDRILQEADKMNILIGAECAGPLIVAKAGLLKNKRFTHGYGELHKSYLKKFWKGATFTDKLIEIDGNIVTAKAQ